MCRLPARGLTEFSCHRHQCSYCAGMALRVGIVGTGFGARVQVPGFRAAGFEITAICSAHLDRARAAAEQAGIPVAVDAIGALVGPGDGGGVWLDVTPPLRA